MFIGITQEQHAERCALYKQWQGFEFPILWDPFNLTGSKVVPRFIAVDEHGIVRSTRLRPQTLEEEFLSVEFKAPSKSARVDVHAGVCSFGDLHGRPSAISSLSQHKAIDESVSKLQALTGKSPKDARAAFHSGVAYRLRYDSKLARPGDFQAAIDAWTRALALDPNQYIWRRRIQQYGPRMDKPYPFYTWTEQARKELMARGETPIQLVARLTGAELAEPRRAAPAAGTEPEDPDPDGKIRADSSGLITIESAVAFDTSGKRRVASVHLALRPDEKRDVHWNHEAGPHVQVWVDAPMPRLLNVPTRKVPATFAGLQQMNFELELMEGEEEMILPAYALYYVCEGETGQCLYLRQEFEIVVKRP